MALTMRPTGLAAPVDNDRQDFTVYCGGWAMGRIYEERGGPDHMGAGSGRCTASSASPLTCAPTATRQRSTRQGRSSNSAWRRWLAWAKLQETH